jgi:hypothetical protein
MKIPLSFSWTTGIYIYIKEIKIAWRTGEVDNKKIIYIYKLWTIFPKPSGIADGLCDVPHRLGMRMCLYV